ncbi:heterokaryon incompatibility protein-domain-containing protein [Lophiotrema nucula]|uniref:Heterokaryon incompatibility protein-domain-containing protein n=1 Tax=Lophiotrema nucula TaxID=690887 RepID=A0A6A5YED6_9PLEO|nr:heterokaryon incompatibility protein-domain-containing protein [Lophiotrema nucula]
MRLLVDHDMSTIWVRQNLSRALRHLRLLDRPRVLWVDAICINQYSVAERSREVTRMGTIFRLAKKVIAWLGLPTPDSEQALEALQYLGGLVETNFNWIFRSKTNNLKHWIPADGPPVHDATLETLERLFSQPYFWRVWIVQELLLANRHSRLQCGKSAISWPVFRRSIFFLKNSKLFRPIFDSRLASMSLFTDLYITTEILLERSRVRHCSDMRDKIYGILTSEIVADAPSWVFDLVTTPASKMWNAGRQAAPSSGSTVIYIPPDRIDVIGVFHSNIVSVSERITSDVTQASRVVGQYQPREWSSRSNEGADSELDEWLRLLQMDQIRDRYIHSSVFPSLTELRDSWDDAATHGQLSPESKVLNLGLVSTVIGGSLIRTANNYAGFGPSTARPGDSIVVLLGCFTPMIIRSQGNGSYTVIGPCHLQGLMNGETLLQALPEPWTIQMYAEDRYFVPRFYNNDTKVLSADDPRLPPLPENWRKLSKERTAGDPAHVSYFEHVSTGQVINSDPQLLRDALRSRGVELKTFQLV